MEPDECGIPRFKCDGTRVSSKLTSPFISAWSQFNRLLASVLMLDTSCSRIVWRLLSTHSVLQLPLHFPYLGSQCAITFQLVSTLFLRNVD